MWNSKLQKTLTTLCLVALFLTPIECFQIGNQKGGLSDLLTASIIGLVLGGVRNRVRQQQAASSQQPHASANHPRPMFLPWQTAAPVPQYPMMQPSHVIPSLHPQLIQPQPFFQDISPLLMQLGEEQIYAPMATHLVPSSKYRLFTMIILK
ncbi:hypothetical protein TNIN_135381 [Trichonephila inaurata madagascariensis]|uniref:Uncharacterized protein n=1 Tax=Trichonephila inaurata madagascariensis TaxID=2747483 RepID=A0A8X7CIG6_9ARAC|nr:hypothetical protein TNIN_135381 [Trichonephila inaurata madagascariensis]